MHNFYINSALICILTAVTSACGEPKAVAVQAEPATSKPLDGLFGSSNDKPRPADEVFIPGIFGKDANTLEVDVRIFPGHYLYKDKIAVRSLTANVTIGKLELPEGVIKADEWFGEQEVYFNEVFGTVHLQRTGDTEAEVRIELSYQGCKVDGLCYLPVSKELTVTPPTRVAYPFD